MLTSSISMSSVVSSVSSAVSAASSSAASSTSVMVTGIAVGSALIAVMFFITLLGRELVDSAEGGHLSTRAFNVALLPLAIAFSINVGVQVLAYLNFF